MRRQWMKARESDMTSRRKQQGMLNQSVASAGSADKPQEKPAEKMEEGSAEPQQVAIEVQTGSERKSPEAPTCHDVPSENYFSGDHLQGLLEKYG